ISPAVRQRQAGTYGHAPDYSWLQGVLNRSRTGRLSLSYLDAKEHDAWGGKVCLEDDPRFTRFKEGAAVFVEGEIGMQNRQPMRDPIEHYPRYRIREIRAAPGRD